MQKCISNIFISLGLISFLLISGQDLVASTPKSFRQLIQEHWFGDEEEKARTGSQPFEPYINFKEGDDILFSKLKNDVDTGLIPGEGYRKWLERRDQRWQEYIDAESDVTKKRERLQRKEKLVKGVRKTTVPPEDHDEPTASVDPAEAGFALVPKKLPKEEEERNAAKEDLERAEAHLKAVTEKLIGRQGYYRTLDADSLRKMIHTPSITMADYQRTKKQHPYKVNPRKLVGKNRVEGFILHPDEILLALTSLDLFIERLENKDENEKIRGELAWLEEGLIFYNSVFRPVASEWIAWANLNSTIQAKQDKLEEILLKKFGSPPSRLKWKRDRTTDEGRLLAKIERDELGQHRYKIWSKIKAVTSPVVITGGLAQLNAHYDLLPRFVEPDPQQKKVKFEDVYKGVDNLNGITQTDKVGRSLAWFYQILTRAYVPESGKPRQRFVVPAGAQMADGFRTTMSMDFHRGHLIFVFRELYKAISPSADDKPMAERLETMRNPAYNTEEARVWRYGKNAKEYKQKLKKIVELLTKQCVTHLKLHVPPPRTLGMGSYIPTAWNFLTNDLRPKVPPARIMPGTELYLMSLGIEDKMLAVQDESSQDPSLLGSYLKISLTRNKLTGACNYGFGRSLTELSLRDNQLKSLQCVSGLTALRKLDVSHNQLSRLHLLLYLENLTDLNVSFNQVIDPAPLKDLPKLEKLDLSNNKIAAFPMLRNPVLRFLDAGSNPLEGMWQESLPHPLALPWLESLDLTGYGEGFKLYGVGGIFKKDDFKLRFPAIQKLKTHYENFEWEAPLNESNAEIS